MENTTATVAVQQVVQNILEGKTDFLSLDFTTGQGREIALNCLLSKQLLSRQLDTENAAHREVLKHWIEGNYSNLIILNKEQRHKDLVDIYLSQKYKEQLQKWETEKDVLWKCVSVIRSYSGQQVICYNYSTKEGEAVCYFDKALGIPVRLKTTASFKLKIDNALRLVEKIDVELPRVDLRLSVNFINNHINNSLRETLLSIIDGKNISYYDLPRYFGYIREQLTENLQKTLDACGLVVAEIKIDDIAISNNTSEKLENQYFALAEIARVKEFENRMEEESLKLYEKKAMIHDKYPSFDVGLTEAEKDMALNRYLQRTGQEKEKVVEIKHEKFEKRIDGGTELVTKASIKKPVEPEPLVPKKKYLLGYVIGAGIWLALSILLIVFVSNAGIAVLCVGAAVLVGVGVLLRHELKYGVSKSVRNDYLNKMEEYRKNMEEYMAHKNDYVE